MLTALSEKPWIILTNRGLGHAHSFLTAHVSLACLPVKHALRLHVAVPGSGVRVISQALR